MSTDEPTKVENLVLEQLRAIRGQLANMGADLSELRSRIGHLEEQSAALFGLHSTISTRMDRFNEKIERIERRLELVE